VEYDYAHTQTTLHSHTDMLCGEAPQGTHLLGDALRELLHLLL
jgi:hypothetical protein